MKKFSSTMRANSRRISPIKKRITVVAAATLIIILLVFFLPRTTYLLAALVVTPVNALRSWVENSSASLPVYLRDRTELLRQINTIKQQLADSSGDRYTSEMLAEENQQLRALLGNGDEKRILAGVIGRPSVLPFDLLMLDRGSADGIVANAPVYVGEKTVIGFIQSVTEHTALVTLITSPGFSSTVYVFGPNIYAPALGQGGGQLRVGIPQGITVREGDLVILPSAASGVYGLVNHIENTPAQPEQYAFVAPKVPLASLRLVSVGLSPLRDISFSAAATTVGEARSTLFNITLPPNYLTGSSSASSTRATTSSSSVEVRP